MASKSLGTLTIDLIAKTGGFISGMDKAERASENGESKYRKMWLILARPLLAYGHSSDGCSNSSRCRWISTLKSTSEQVANTDKWAKSLKMSTQELLAWQFAAERAGLSGENMADIFRILAIKLVMLY